MSKFCVGRLLRAGADLTALTYKLLSPLHFAAKARQSNVIGLLLSEYQKSGDIVRLIDLEDEDTHTALHHSCQSGRPESVQYLLANGANHSAKDRQGRTPFHALAEFPEKHASKWSKEEYGASTRLNDDTERTVDIIDMLVQAVADLQTRDGGGTGKTPMDLAVDNSCTEMVNELRRRGMKASDPFEESMVPRPQGIEEAKLLLGHDYPESAQGGSITDGTPSSKLYAGQFERLLQLCEYDLLKELVKCGADLKAIENAWSVTGLHKLVYWGHASLLEYFAEEASQLNNAESIDNKDDPGTLLCHACARELPSLDVIKVLVEKAKIDVNRISDRHGRYGFVTTLHVLASGHHFWNIEALEYLIKNGADIEVADAGRETPLMVAVRSDGFWKEETIRVLLEHSANPNVIDAIGKSCLNKSDHPNVSRILIQHGADIMIGKPPILTSAVGSMNLETDTVLLEAGANPNILPLTSEPDPERRRRDYRDARYPLHDAAKPSASREPPPGWYRLRSMMTTLLLKHGADPYAAYDDGSIVLQRVIEDHGDTGPFWQLANINTEHQGGGGRTPLISACYPGVTPHPHDYGKPKPKATGMPDDALLLLDRGADAIATDHMGRSALHWLCTMPDELEETHRAVFTGLTQRAPGLIHLRDNDGFKPLQLAIKNAHTWTADTLIILGADMTEADPDGNTALHILARRLCGEKTKAVVAAERFRHYVSLGVPIEQRNKDGETPLLTFISTSWVGTSGRSNPTNAIENDISHRKAFCVFADAGADVFVTNDRGETLLHVTAKRWYEEEYVEWEQREDMVEIFQDLMALGLDPRVDDERMRTAIDVAVASGNHSIVDLFRETNED